jgi:hypothetical protein
MVTGNAHRKGVFEKLAPTEKITIAVARQTAEHSCNFRRR